MQEPSFALSFTPGESARGTAQRMASKEEARMAESVAPRVQAPALWDMFTADDAVWFLWSVLLVVPAGCGIALLFVWHPLLWKVIGVLLSLACALLFATNLAPVARPDLSRELVLITGGTTGLGLELGQQLVKRGAKVIAFALLEPESKIDGIETYVCDVSNREAVRNAAEKLRREVGEPTIVVNNAGVVSGKLLLDLSEADVRNTFGVNTLAQFWVVQEFLPAMIRASRGHIVNISSVMGLIACAQMTDYCASKAAVVSFHACLRNELDYRYASPEVRTTLVLPGHISTRLFERTILPGAWGLRVITKSLSPESVARAIVRAIEGGKANTVLRLPVFTHSARLLGPTSALVPGPILRLSHWLSGGDWAMAEYGPKPDAGQQLIAERQQASQNQKSL